MKFFNKTYASMTLLMVIANMVLAADGEMSPHGCPQLNAAAQITLSLNAETLGKQLNLSHEQIEKIRSILADASTPLYAMQEKLQDFKIKLAELHQAKPVDNAALQAIAKQQARVLADVLQLRGQIRADINAVLTPEQQAQLRELHHDKDSP